MSRVVVVGLSRASRVFLRVLRFSSLRKINLSLNIIIIKHSYSVNFKSEKSSQIKIKFSTDKLRYITKVKDPKVK